MNFGILGSQSTVPRRANDATSVAATAVAESVEEARLPGIAKLSAATAATLSLQKSQSLLVLVNCVFLQSCDRI